MLRRRHLRAATAGAVLAALVQPGPYGLLLAQARPDVLQDVAPPPSETAPLNTAAPPEAPADLGDPNVTPERLAFNRVLVDAAVLLNDYEKSKRSRNRSKPSISAFRSLEIQLQSVVDADAANTQARDMMNAMRQVQGEILQPSIMIAAIATRQLFADELARQLGSQDIKVTSSGRGDTVLTIASPAMTRDLALQLNTSARIFERTKMLQFERVVFRGGRGRWTYDVQRARFR